MPIEKLFISFDPNSQESISDFLTDVAYKLNEIIDELNDNASAR